VRIVLGITQARPGSDKRKLAVLDSEKDDWYDDDNTAFSWPGPHRRSGVSLHGFGKLQD